MAWSSGFRLQGSYWMDTPIWVCDLEWTSYGSSCLQNYNSEINNAINVNQLGSFPAWNLNPTTLSTDFVNSSSLKWHLLLNRIDLMIRRVYVYYNLNFSPFIGLSSAWINQNFNVTYFSGVYQQSFISPGQNNFSPVEIYMKNNFWGLGPNVGINAEIGLMQGFGLFGSFAAAPLMGVYHVNQEGNYLEKEIFHYSKSPFGITTLLDFTLGLIYKKSIFQNQYGLSCKLGYEFHEFFHIYALTKDKYRVLSRNSNLTLQGVVINACLDF